MEAPSPIQIINNNLYQKNHNKINNEKKEYLFELNNIKYKLLLFIDNNYINFKVIQLDGITISFYYQQYDLEQIINIFKLNYDLYNDLSEIIKLIDDEYLNNKISINNINNDINIKFKFPIGNKEYECTIVLNKRELYLDEKIEVILNEIKQLKETKNKLIINRIKEIEELIFDLKDSINKKIKENEEIINKLKNKNEINKINNEKIKNEIKILKKEIFNLNLKSKIIKIKFYSGKICYGFLMKAYKGEIPFYFLITNEVNESMIKLKEKIELNYENKSIKIELNEKERFIRNYKYLNIDTTIVEIIPKDNIDKKYFLLPYKDNNNLTEMKVDIIYKEEDDINKLNDEIKLINLYEFKYLSDIKNKISGTPIFKMGTREVIGINKKDNENSGMFIWPIINSLKLNLEYKKEVYEDGIYKVKGIYEGEMKNNIREGYGKMTSGSGSYYIGEWLDNKMHGKGIMFYKNNTIHYEGNFVKGKKEGQGKLIAKDGQYYIGEFLDNLMHGKGILFNKNNTIHYEGNFVKDKKEGHGKLIFKDGKYYIGEFHDNLMHGKGIIYNKNNTIVYEGNFVNGKVKGYGKYIYEDGNYYIGEWLNGLRHGKGKLYYKNNTIHYEGNFVNNKEEGYGKLFWQNGEYYIGEFSNGLRHGKGAVYSKNNTIKYEGNFINDKFID